MLIFLVSFISSPAKSAFGTYGTDERRSVCTRRKSIVNRPKHIAITQPDRHQSHVSPQRNHYARINSKMSTIVSKEMSVSKAILAVCTRQSLPGRLHFSARCSNNRQFVASCPQNNTPPEQQKMAGRQVLLCPFLSRD